MYPAVILYSNHYVGPEENKVYLVNDQVEATVALQRIAADHLDFMELETRDAYSALHHQDFKAWFNFMGVNCWANKNWFDGHITLKPVVVVG